MYQVKIFNGANSTIIHDIARMEDSATLSYGRLKRGINKIDTFVFRVLPNNPGYDSVIPFQTTVQVLQIETQKIIFRGRVLTVSYHMGTQGQLYHEVTCEDFMGYLNDSVQTYEPMQQYQASEYFVHLIDKHNAYVEPAKQFVAGAFTTSIDIPISRMFTFKKTWDAMQDSLFNLGGELQIRYESEATYLDFVAQTGESRATTIELGKNMRAIDREDDLTKIITRLWPLGDELESQGDRVTIASVNGGVPYLDTGLSSEFGIVNGIVKWDGVTNPNTLLSNAQNWIANNNRAIRSYRVDVLDLSLLGLDIDSLNLGDTYPVKNSLLGIDTQLRIIATSMDLLEPYQSTVDFGDKHILGWDVWNEAVNNAGREAVDIVNRETNEIRREIEDVYTELIEQTTSVRQDMEAIVLEAITDYVRTGDFETFQETVMAQLQIMADGIQMNFSQITQQIVDNNGIAETTFQQISQYIRFEAGNIILGESDSPMQCVITNDSMQFQSNGYVVAYFANNRMYIAEAEILNRLIIGNWVISYESNGDLSVDKI